MRLNAPKKMTWWISMLFVVVGIVANFVKIPFVSDYNLWFVVVGYILIWLGSFVKGF